MPDFRITPSPGGPMLDHRYQDDPANMVYGYVSSPYGTTGNTTGSINATYGTRQPTVYEVNLNGPNIVNSHIPQRTMYNDEDELQLQKHMSNLAIHGINTSPGSAVGMSIADGEQQQQQVN